MMRAAVFALLFAACATATTPPALHTAPWRGTPLSRAEVPPIYVTEWEKAENRATCALLAPRSLGEGSAATPRAARFSGGWAVAYDLPDRRSAFGIAGAGVKAGDPSYAKWPYVQTWDDGSKAEYGPEGGQGPNQLAYLRIEGQDCLYNVWSHLGREHLEHLLSELRFVR
jgi:hypothetical protein